MALENTLSVSPGRDQPAPSTSSSDNNDIDDNNDNNENEEFYFNMDNDGNDYRELRDSLITTRRNSTHSHHSEIQRLNYRNLPLLNLPTEVLLQIFHHLDRRDLYLLLSVCHEFADLIIEILWFRPNMQNDGSFKKIRAIMQQRPDSTHWTYRRFIKRLNLSFMTKLVDDELLALFVGCPKLERLTLVNCTKLTHGPITAVLHQCERLQSIDLTGVQDIHDDIIYLLAKNCTRLQGLYAPGCGKVSEEAILTLLKSCPMLKRIKFNNSDNITNNSIVAMYENCKSLVEIDLHNCPNVTDKYLKHIFADLSQLREFRISQAPGITDKLFELVPEDSYLEKLRIIDITGCNAITDRLVEKLVKCAPRLRNVVLSKCMQITDASLRALAQLGRSLHYIHLGHCLLITDFGVQSLVRACHRIQYIDLACCSQLTDWTLIELSSLPKLRRIGLVKCNLISDNGILELVRRRGENDCLERVHLSYCTSLTVGPIYLLLKNCPKLTHLSLTGITAFLRREITQYCRDPPPDFNEAQKSSFCVFLGHGVSQLRSHLNQVMEESAYLIEHGDATLLGQERRRRRLAIGPNESIIREPMPRALVDDAEMNAWAAQRGLGVLHAVPMVEAQDPEVTEINREIFRELSDGNMTPEEMRDHFRNILRNRQRQRILERQLEGDFDANGQPITNQEPTNAQMLDRIQLDHPRAQPRGATRVARDTDAPQLTQGAVFAFENVTDAPEDVEMEPVDLFPRENDG